MITLAYPATWNPDARELEQARRELAASLALTRPGSPARVPILAHLAAIDGELVGRDAQQP